MSESKKIRWKTICGPENVGPKKCWLQKNVSWSKKKLDSNNVWVPNKICFQGNLGLKIFGPKIVGLKKICVQNNFWVQRIMCSNNIRSKQIFGSKKYVRSKNCWVQNLFIFFWGQYKFAWGLTKLKVQIKFEVKNNVSPTRFV